MKRAVAWLLVVVMLITCLPVSVLAADEQSKCSIRVKDASAMAGQTVCVEVVLEENPGIQGATLTMEWDEGLTLESVENGEAFQSFTTTFPKNLVSGKSYVWYSQTTVEASDALDGTILKLNFRVSEKAEDGQKFGVRASCVDGDFFNKNFETIQTTIENGVISVVSYTPGDVDGNSRLNAKDLVQLSQYIADGCMTDPEGYNISLNPNAGDVNDDGRLNARDLVLISQYIADGCMTDPDSYNVTLKPSSHDFGHVHSMQEMPYKAPTCTEEGNIAYWYCTGCGKYFSNAGGTTQITQESIVIPKAKHEYVDGSCKYCGTPEPETGYEYKITYNEAAEVLVQDDTDKSKYNISGSGKNYLEQKVAAGTIKNTNTAGYNSSEGYYLKDLSCKGLTFKGWYDAAGNHISEIPIGAKRDYELYAHWIADKYTLTYKTYKNLPMPTSQGDATTVSTSFTVFEGVQNLWDPDVKDYIFLGWYRDDGTEAFDVPVGTAEDVTLQGYCTSRRNYAVSKQDNNPIILEDQNNNVVYFTYEIGEIRNIPLNPDKPFWTIESVEGLDHTVIEEHSTIISKTASSSISQTISNMTVSSNTWSLSNTWDEVLHNNVSCSQSHAEESEDCKSMASTSSNSFSVTDKRGGSSYHKSEDGSTVYDYDSKTTTKDKGHQFDASLNGTYSNKMSASFGKSNEYGTENSYSASNAYTKEGKVAADKWSASGSQSGSESASSSVSDKDKYSSGIGFENGYEINAGLKYGYHNNTNTVTKTGSDTVTNKSNIDENTSSWNNSDTFSATNQSSMSESVRNKLSDIITTTKEYGVSYSNGGTDSTTQGFSSTDSSTEGTTSTVTYNAQELSTITSAYSTNGHVEGRYRCILVGIAHVFGVVGYDYNTKSYFTYTFSVMDDKTEAFLDYTPKGGNFTDCENSCLPFEIPTDVFDYVNERTGKTKGISYTTNSINGTARITRYNGTDTDVIVPAYVSDGTQAYKVTGIESSAFAGKDVRAVVLGENIKTIPAGAFKNCTKLEAVIGGFTEIGDEAFAGCTKLTDMNIPSNVVRIGENAFAGVPTLHVRAINSLCAYAEAVKVLPNGTNTPDSEVAAKQNKITQSFIDSVLTSGAKNITLDLSQIMEGASLTLKVPEIDSIEISGGMKTYRNFSLQSDAKKTTLNGMEISNGNAIPLTIASDTLRLEKVFIDGDATTLILKKDGAVLELDQDSVLQSTAKYTVIGKNPVIKALTASDGATGSLTVVGNFGYVNSIQGLENIEFLNGKEEKITDAEFETVEKGTVTITLNAAGGTVTPGTITAYYGGKLGTLPTPTRDYYSFEGWYTQESGGTVVNEDTPVESVGSTTLYAHWKQNELSSWVLKSEVPEGSEIVNQKWTYDERTNTTSSETSLSGYTQYGSYWVQSSNSTFNYATFPDGFDTSHWIYKQFHKSCDVSAYETETAKREVSTWSPGFVYYKWDYSAPYATVFNRTISHIFRASGDGGYWYGYFHANLSATNHPYLDNAYCNSANLPSYNCSSEFNTYDTAGPTPRFFRFKYYTASYNDYYKMFQYYKIDKRESNSPVSETDMISNVQHWVQYRMK